MPTIATPELDHQKRITDSGEADTVENFYNWLRDQGLHLCRLEDVGRMEPRYMPDNRTPERLIADFFGLNLNKIEAERRAVLQAIGEQL